MVGRIYANRTLKAFQNSAQGCRAPAGLPWVHPIKPLAPCRGARKLHHDTTGNIISHPRELQIIETTLTTRCWNVYAKGQNIPLGSKYDRICFIVPGQDTNVGVSAKGNASIDSQTEVLIDELPQISKVEHVEYALFGGSQFPPALFFSNGRERVKKVKGSVLEK